MVGNPANAGMLLLPVPAPRPATSKRKQVSCCETIAAVTLVTVNQIELAKYFNLNNYTIGRYLKTGKLLLNKYSIRKIK